MRRVQFRFAVSVMSVAIALVASITASDALARGAKKRKPPKAFKIDACQILTPGMIEAAGAPRVRRPPRRRSTTAPRTRVASMNGPRQIRTREFPRTPKKYPKSLLRT